MRPIASKLADGIDLSHYQPVYDVDQKRYPAPIHDVEDLVPPIRKHTYAPDIDPSPLISEQVVFRALIRIDWTTIDFQPLGREEEDAPTQDDPQSSSHPDEESRTGGRFINRSLPLIMGTIILCGLFKAPCNRIV